MTQKQEDNLDKELVRLSLFTISQRLVELMDFRDAENLTAEEKDAVDGEIAKFIAAEIGKVDNLRGFLRHCELMSEGHRGEAKRQAAMAQVWESKADRIKSACIKALELQGKTRAEGKTGVLRIQKNGGQQPMTIDDEKQLPTEYTPMVISYSVDKEKLRKDLEAGKEIPGARLVPRGSHLRVE